MVDKKKRKKKKPSGHGKNLRPAIEAEVREYIDQISDLLNDEEKVQGLLTTLARLFDRDRNLRELIYPAEPFFHLLMETIEESEEQEDSQALFFSDEVQRLYASRLVDEDMKDTALQFLMDAFERRTSKEERQALAFGIMFLGMDLDQEDPSLNPVWALVHINSLRQMKEALQKSEENETQSSDPRIMDSEHYRSVPANLLLKEEETPQTTTEKALEAAYHGIEHGYLDRFVPFHNLVRLPFAMAYILKNLGWDEKEYQTLDARNRVLAELFRSVAQEGALLGVADAMLDLYREALEEASNERENLFYDAIVTVLEAFEPGENPLLPMLYYNHYIHYLAAEDEQDHPAVRSILADPTSPGSYDAYIETLESEGNPEAAERVRKVRVEVLEFSSQGNTGPDRTR